MVIAAATCCLAVWLKAEHASYKPATPKILSLQRATEHLDEIERLVRFRQYADVIDKATALLVGTGDEHISIRLDAYGRLADAQRALRKHDDAFESHAAAFTIKGMMGATAGQYLISYVEMVTDRYLGFRFDEALSTIDEARLQLASALSSEAIGLLEKLEAFVQYCKSDYGTAADKMAKGRAKVEAADRKLNPDATQAGTATLSKDSLMDAVRHRLYLSCWLRKLGQSKNHKKQKDRIQKLYSDISLKILQYGPWKNPSQLPKQYDPRLLAQPWHDWSANGWGTLAGLAGLLERYHSRLKSEYSQLKLHNRLLVDQDCIQEGSHGEWSRFEITGIWNHLDPDSGCSVHTPAACELLKEARNLSPVSILRLGYSAIQPSTWIKPHFGMTNSVLKFHLGVHIPSGGCATMRVGNDTRAWMSGKVVLFDDSFEHEVVNDCDDERVVFQLAIKHPQLRSSPLYQAVVVDAH